MRTLYLARHGAADGDGDLLAEGRTQARLLGERLAGKGVTAVHHSPKPRAAETAAIVAESLGGVPVTASDLVGDVPPSIPDPDDLPPAFAAPARRFIDGFDEQARRDGPGLAERALAEFTAPEDEDVRELVVTHSQMVCWFVRAALGAPTWRWLAINAANAALTVIHYSPGRPDSVALFNDQSHLPAALRWTGFPEERRDVY
jgi:probable phosphoglycerate mutase